VLKLVGSGQLTGHIEGRFRLRDAAQAHSELESRKTIGKLLLIQRALPDERRGLVSGVAALLRFRRSQSQIANCPGRSYGSK
jgi:Zinc-binding dehydrogenase